VSWLFDYRFKNVGLKVVTAHTQALNTYLMKTVIYNCEEMTSMV
jgi:hypothetical protein